MAIFPLAPDQPIAQMWSNGVRGGEPSEMKPNLVHRTCELLKWPGGGLGWTVGYTGWMFQS